MFRGHDQFGRLAVLGVGAMVLLVTVPALAQGSGVLSVSMQVQSSIDLIFVSHPAGCPLTNSGTNNVGLYLGWATQPSVGSHGGCGQYSVVNGATYQMSSPFYLVVNVSNLSSTQYDLRVWVSSPIQPRVTYLLNSQVLSGTRPAAAIQTNAYGTTTQTFAMQVQKQQLQGMVAGTIQFEATAR